MAVFLGDALPPVPPNAPTRDQITAINRIIDELNAQRKLKIINDGTTNRILLGQYQNTFSGLKVSKQGKDVVTASNQDLIFNSEQNVLKIINTNTTSINVPNPLPTGTITATVPHNQTFAPAFLAFVSTPALAAYGIPNSQIVGLPYILPTSIGTADAPLLVQARTDASSIYFDIINYQSAALPDLGGTWSFKYYILQESAT
jgi:hypothetical protein